MSKIGVSLKIDVSKIEKERLFKGEKGTYLNCTAFIEIDAFDQYGNSGMITQDVSKEERDGGVKGPILGNSKVFYTEGVKKPTNDPSLHASGNRNQANPTSGHSDGGFEDQDIPF